MSADVGAAEITRREGRGSFLLWFGALASPTAWAVQLIVNYSLEEWFACAPSAQETGQVLGMDVRTFALLVTSPLLALSIAGGLVAWRCYRRMSAGDGEAADRARWMAVAGIFNGVLYSIIIVASYAVPATLETCRTTP